MKETFDPVSVGELLRTTKYLLFRMAGQRLGKVKTEITPDYLEVVVELKPPDSRLYY